ncbi:hypothetical protein RFI_16108 [Reticulomyxa filosa]|uniref:Uncharacterized protein n=1 Tax=Reticulomyxa filosa TaxID=46433 RepID=X6N484_RETFI|nr:hypothetical protein RFI_16108 [Reticulomyxa filosa]|eukprot:ETO21095.1 hypothetical protein RFI_16108 [Reticulomyxa filosa]
MNLFSKILLIFFSQHVVDVTRQNSPKNICIANLSGFRKRLWEKHVEFFPKEPKILLCCNTIHVLDLERYFQLTDKYLDILTVVQFSPDGSKILGYGTQSGKQIRVFEGHSNIVRGVLFSPDGSKVLSYWLDDRTVNLWDITSGELIQCFEEYSGVKEVQFSLDGSKLLTLSDRRVRLWCILSGCILKDVVSHSDIQGMQFSRDESKVVLGLIGGRIQVYDISSGNLILSIRGHEFITKIQLSSNGSKIISYSKDKTIQILDVSSRETIQVLEGHNGTVNCIHVSPDSSKLVSSSDDGTIRLWGSNSSKIFDLAKTSSVDLIWKVGMQSALSMKGSIWKNDNTEEHSDLFCLLALLVNNKSFFLVLVFTKLTPFKIVSHTIQKLVLKKVSKLCQTLTEKIIKSIIKAKKINEILK